MPTHDPERAPTIDMTLEGEMLAPPTFWSRARAIWRVLPPGTIPALMVMLVLFMAAAIFLVGVLVVAVPVVLVLAIIGLLVRASASSRGRPPVRR